LFLGDRIVARISLAISGFDSAALDAVRAWHFSPPSSGDVPDTLFLYAVLGFRAPLGPATASPR
jgi:hypothetical protein